MRLWLVRHGETEANVAGLYSGRAPTPLTAHGVAQAQALGELLREAPFDAVWCSELARAQRTARLLLGDRRPPQRELAQLNEMFFGDWEMRHHRDLCVEDSDNYAAWCADWQRALPPNGEGFAAFSQRVAGLLPLLARRHHQHLLIVSHQGPLSLLIALLLKMPAAALWRFPIEQGAWSAIDITEDFAALRVLNSRARWRVGE